MGISTKTVTLAFMSKFDKCTWHIHVACPHGLEVGYHFWVVVVVTLIPARRFDAIWFEPHCGPFSRFGPSGSIMFFLLKINLTKKKVGQARGYWSGQSGRCEYIHVFHLVFVTIIGTCMVGY